MLDSIRQVTGDPRFDELCWRLNDYRDVTEAVTSVDEMEEVAAYSAAGALSRRHASCPGLIAQVTTDPAHRRLIDAYLNLGIVPYRSRTFDTPEAARAWIAAELQGLGAPAVPAAATAGPRPVVNGPAPSGR